MRPDRPFAAAMRPWPLLVLMLAGCAASLPTMPPPCQCPAIPAPPVAAPPPLPNWQPTAETYSQKVRTYFDNARRLTTSEPPK